MNNSSKLDGNLNRIKCLFMGAEEGSLMKALIDDKPRGDVDTLLESDENQDGCFIACFHYKYRDKKLFEKLLPKNTVFYRCLELSLYEDLLNCDLNFLKLISTLDQVDTKTLYFEGSKNLTIKNFINWYNSSNKSMKVDDPIAYGELTRWALSSCFYDKNLFIKSIKISNMDIGGSIYCSSTKILQDPNAESIRALNSLFEYLFQIIEFENENFKTYKRYSRDVNLLIETPSKILNLFDNEELKENIEKVKQLKLKSNN